MKSTYIVVTVFNGTIRRRKVRAYSHRGAVDSVTGYHAERMTPAEVQRMKDRERVRY